MAHRLVIQRKGKRPQIFRLMQSTVVVGRGHGTDLLLPDISVSRQHARVETDDDDGHRIIDLGSQNGTKVNGQRITESPLADGDELQIGKFLLTYEKKPARRVDEDDTLASYSIEDERTGFLKAVTKIDGDEAHNTSTLSKDQLEAMRSQVHIQDHGRLVCDSSGEEHTIGDTGLLFGKGGIPISGSGIGGSARVEWDGSAHMIEKIGGLLFSITVNGRKVEVGTSLSSGDAVIIGKTRFTYET
jgi:pSer/pThr/pTyr-binding forkhead associated (FHA) protein